MKYAVIGDFVEVDNDCLSTKPNESPVTYWVFVRRVQEVQGKRKVLRRVKSRGVEEFVGATEIEAIEKMAAFVEQPNVRLIGAEPESLTETDSEKPKEPDSVLAGAHAEEKE